MSENEHTPGPWQIVLDGEISDDDGDVWPHQMIGPNGEVVARLDDTEASEADLRLWERAPDLLARVEALEAALNDIGGVLALHSAQFGDPHGTIREAVGIAVAALGEGGE